MNVFFVGGFALLYTIGDYDEAVVLAQNEDDEIITTSRRRGLDDAISRLIPELT